MSFQMKFERKTKKEEIWGGWGAKEKKKGLTLEKNQKRKKNIVSTESSEKQKN